MLAEMYVWVESMRLYTYQVLRAAHTVSGSETGRGDIHKLTAAGIMYTAEPLNKGLNHAVQIHGVSGSLWEAEINRMNRPTKSLETGAATTQTTRNASHMDK